MKKILFSDQYGLTQAVLDGRKTMMRRILPYEVHPFDTMEDLLKYSRYKIGEVVAIAQPYKKAGFCGDELDRHKASLISRGRLDKSKGWANKMFVRADAMPHHIKITDIKVERLQDISEDDYLKEGIYEHSDVGGSRSLTDYAQHGYTFGSVFDANKLYETPRDAFAALIDKVNGKGTWESNPWVFAYSFELID